MEVFEIVKFKHFCLQSMFEKLWARVLMDFDNNELCHIERS